MPSLLLLLDGRVLLCLQWTCSIECCRRWRWPRPIAGCEWWSTWSLSLRWLAVSVWHERCKRRRRRGRKRWRDEEMKQQQQRRRQRGSSSKEGMDRMGVWLVGYQYGRRVSCRPYKTVDWWMTASLTAWTFETRQSGPRLAVLLDYYTPWTKVVHVYSSTHVFVIAIGRAHRR